MPKALQIWATKLWQPLVLAHLEANGVPVRLANKLGEGVPTIIDEIKAGHISMVINTTSHGRESERDGWIRRSTVEHAIACLLLLTPLANCTR